MLFAVIIMSLLIPFGLAFVIDLGVAAGNSLTLVFWPSHGWPHL